jgi:Putative restriction endonuclease
VLLVAEVVSPGSETTDRVLKPAQYATAGIQFHWRVEQTAQSACPVCTYVLDRASGRHREAELFAGVVKATVPFPVDIEKSGGRVDPAAPRSTHQ